MARLKPRGEVDGGGGGGEKETLKKNSGWEGQWNKIKYRIPHVRLTRHLAEDLFDVFSASPAAMPISSMYYTYETYSTGYTDKERNGYELHDDSYRSNPIISVSARIMYDRCKNIVLFSGSGASLRILCLKICYLFSYLRPFTTNNSIFHVCTLYLKLFFLK